MEINGKIGKTTLIRCRAWYRQANYLHMAHLIFSPLTFILPHFFPSQPPRSLSFNCFWFIPKHPVINLVQSPNTPPLHPIMCPKPVGSNTSWSVKFVPQSSFVDIQMSLFTHCLTLWESCGPSLLKETMLLRALLNQVLKMCRAGVHNISVHVF